MTYRTWKVFKVFFFWKKKTISRMAFISDFLFWYWWYVPKFVRTTTSIKIMLGIIKFTSPLPRCFLSIIFCEKKGWIWINLMNLLMQKERKKLSYQFQLPDLVCLKKRPNRKHLKIKKNSQTDITDTLNKNYFI